MAIDHDSKFLYLDLMKKTLSFLLWDNEHTKEQKENGLVWPVHAHTMIGLRRLENIQFCMQDVLDKSIPGDFVETGVWRGGACILMRAVLAANGVNDRKVFVVDSFQGLPPPDTVQYPQDTGDSHYQIQYLSVSQETVMDNFSKYGLLDENVIFLKGWFKDTLPTAPIDKIAVLRLDGDMYQSTTESLTYLYPKLSIGGYCIIDDWALPSAKKATMDYRESFGITAPLQAIDPIAVFWRKES